MGDGGQVGTVPLELASARRSSSIAVTFSRSSVSGLTPQSRRCDGHLEGGTSLPWGFKTIVYPVKDLGGGQGPVLRELLGVAPEHGCPLLRGFRRRLGDGATQHVGLDPQRPRQGPHRPGRLLARPGRRAAPAARRVGLRLHRAGLRLPRVALGRPRAAFGRLALLVGDELLAFAIGGGGDGVRVSGVGGFGQPWIITSKNIRHTPPAAAASRFAPLVSALFRHCALRNIGRRHDYRSAIADDEPWSVVVVLTDEFKALHPGLPGHVEAALPCRGIRAGIVNRDLVSDRVEVGAREPFDHVQLVGRRHSQVVDPHALVESDGVDHQRVALPVPDRMSAIARRQVWRVSPAIHEDRPEAVRATGFENVEALVLPIVDQLRAVRRRDLPRASRRLAPHIGLVPDLDAIGKQRPGPRLKRNLAELRL